MSTIGKLAKGKPKNFSEEEIQRRKERMEAMNKRRRVHGWTCASCGKGGIDPIDYAEIKGEENKAYYCEDCGRQLEELGKQVVWTKI